MTVRYTFGKIYATISGAESELARLRQLGVKPKDLKIQPVKAYRVRMRKTW